MTYDYEDYWLAEAQHMKQNFVEDSFRMRQITELRECIVQYGYGHSAARVLELGAGFGRVTQYLMSVFQFENYTAVDISPDQLEHVRAACPTVKLVRRDITKPILNPVAVFEQDFDLIFSVELLMHVKPQDLETVFWLMNSVCTKLGVIMNLDYAPNIQIPPLAEHNFIHPYEIHYQRISRNPYSVHVGKGQRLFIGTP